MSTGPRRDACRLASRTAIAALVVGLSTLAACGVPLDSRPRAINRTEQVERPETTPTTSGSPAAPQLAVYFLRDKRLEAELKPVEGEPSVADALEFLLSGPEDPGLQSRIPPATQLRSVEVEDRLATIDLTDEIGGISGQPGKEAFAQLAFTALAADDVDRVRFLVQGEPVVAPTDDGNIDIVVEGNYEPPLAP